MGKLYGPSDVLSFQLPGGHTHTFFRPADRELSPGYGVEDRSLPVLDCADCAEWAKTQGWHANASKVQRTTDEADFEAEAQQQGTLNMRIAAEAIGNALARTARDEQSNITRSTTTARRRVGAK